jgi:hypothetical protein
VLGIFLQILKQNFSYISFKIAPPPGLKVAAVSQQQKINKPATQNNKNNNDWGNFSDFGNNSAQGTASQGNSGFTAFGDSWSQPTTNTSTWDSGFSNQGFGTASLAGAGFGAGSSAGVGFGAGSSVGIGAVANQGQQGFAGWQNQQSFPSQTQQGFGSQTNQIRNQPQIQGTTGGQDFQMRTDFMFQEGTVGGGISQPTQQQPKKPVETNLLDLL